MNDLTFGFVLIFTHVFAFWLGGAVAFRDAKKELRKLRKELLEENDIEEIR